MTPYDYTQFGAPVKGGCRTCGHEEARHAYAATICVGCPCDQFVDPEGEG